MFGRKILKRIKAIEDKQNNIINLIMQISKIDNVTVVNEDGFEFFELGQKPITFKSRKEFTEWAKANYPRSEKFGVPDMRNAPPPPTIIPYVGPDKLETFENK